MENSSQSQVAVKRPVGSTLSKKIIILTVIMVSLIIVAVVAYIISFYNNNPKITTSQGAVEYMEVGQTEDPCSVIDSVEQQDDCLTSIGSRLDEIADYLNSL